VGLLLLLPIWQALTQDTVTLDITGVNPSAMPTITVTTDIVDTNGRPVAGLAQSDFTLSGALAERAAIVRVENVTDDNLTFATVLVIDVSSSMAGKPLQEAQAAAKQFVESVGANDPIAIITFSNDPLLVLPYTTDKDLLKSTIDNLRYGGRTALYDAAVLAAEVAATAPTPRRAIVLLSDGAEYGGASVNGRNDGLDAAQTQGVSVYTIGLGFNDDTTYLQALSDGTNARFYDSPEPAQLSEIYSGLATLFRSQYVVTLDFADYDPRLDGGSVFEFGLQAANSNTATAELRVPVPIPVVELPADTFAAPIAATITVTPIIKADDAILRTSILAGDQTVDNVDSITINPLDYAPGEYLFTVIATDVDGETGMLETRFTIAPLPSTLTLDGLAATPLTAPADLTVTGSGQTPLTAVRYSAAPFNATSADRAGNFPTTLDPFLFAAGAYTLTVTGTNAGGVSSELTQAFTVGAVAPRIESIAGITDGQTLDAPVSVTVNASGQAGTTINSISATAGATALDLTNIDPQVLPSGAMPITITVTASNGQTTTQTVTVEVAALPPVVTITGVPETLTSDSNATVTVISQTALTAVTSSINDGDAIAVPAATGNAGISEFPLPLPLNSFIEGENTLTLTVTDSSGQTMTQTVTVNVVLPTPTPNLTATADAQVALVQATTNAQATLDTQSTLDAQNAAAAQATLDAQATQNAQATVNAQGTLDAASTAAALASATAQVTATAQAQASAIAQATFNIAITETISIEETLERQATLDTQATANAQATAVAQANLDAFQTATADAQATTIRASTLTAVPQLTATAQANVAANAAATNTAEALNAAATSTANAELTEEVTAEPTAEATVAATLSPTNTPRAVTTPSPVPTLVEIGDTTPDPLAALGINPETIALVCGIGLLFMLLIVIYFLFGRQRNDENPRNRR
jgi:VWFA-related protein